MKENSCQITLTESIETYLLNCTFERKLDDKTISAYRLDLNQFAAIIQSEVSLCELSKEDVSRWLQVLSKYRHGTVKRKIASLHGFMRYLENEYDWFDSPLRRMRIRIKNPVRLPEVMTSEEVKRVLKYLEYKAGTVETNSSYILAMRNRAVIELLFGSGMRVGELCGLCNRDVDMRRGQIHIIGKGNKERIVDICLPVIKDALKKWLAARSSSARPDSPFFTTRQGRALAPQTVRSLVERLRTVCRIDKHVTPHTFRHTFATLLLEEDVDIASIQRILGHSSITTTQIYLHVSSQRQRKILRTKHPRGKM